MSWPLRFMGTRRVALMRERYFLGGIVLGLAQLFHLGCQVDFGLDDVTFACVAPGCVDVPTADTAPDTVALDTRPGDDIGNVAPSCVGRCSAAFDPNLPCQCNASCLSFGNCCPDACNVCSAQMSGCHPSAVSSCEGRCGEAFVEGRPCYCNADCVAFGNCCPDACQRCGDQIAGCEPSALSCAGRCGEPYFPGKPCYCALDCVRFGNCCSDLAEVCPP
jgi:hypothetical protein